MLKIPATYEALLKRVKQTLIEGQQRVESERVRTYWETGRIIHGHILQNKDRADYGAHVIADLARDLKVDKSLVNRCLKFAQKYPSLPNVARGPHLSWSHYRRFIAIGDEKKRLRLEEQAKANEWTAEELGEQIKLGRDSNDKPLPPKRKTPQTPLVPLRGELYTYRIVTRPTVGAGEDSGLLIDLGFGIFRECESKSVLENDIVRSSKRDDNYRLTKIEATAAQLFTYAAYVERVIDGDTLKVRLDLGFGMFTRHELRLRGIDCPEMSTKAGEAARAFVQSYIKEAQQIIVRSSRNDKCNAPS
ncbi:MAG: hypothetical protein JNN05_06650 [Candidatus Omnitrophica bacterium]|nr:hypothetical protein [Candidatus Omnitrophota bacterium]